MQNPRCGTPTQKVPRVAYINEEAHVKDPSTIFHSPFQNGKRNVNFHNPSLLSSNIFYGDISPTSSSQTTGTAATTTSNHPQLTIELKKSQLTKCNQAPPANSTETAQSPHLRSTTPRLKRQFDHSVEHLKDHFVTGLVIPAAYKRNLKKYHHATSPKNHPNQPTTHNTNKSIASVKSPEQQNILTPRNHNNSYIQNTNETNIATTWQPARSSSALSNNNPNEFRRQQEEQQSQNDNRSTRSTLSKQGNNYSSQADLSKSPRQAHNSRKELQFQLHKPQPLQDYNDIYQPIPSKSPLSKTPSRQEIKSPHNQGEKSIQIEKINQNHIQLSDNLSYKAQYTNMLIESRKAAHESYGLFAAEQRRQQEQSKQMRVQERVRSSQAINREMEAEKQRIYEEIKAEKIQKVKQYQEILQQQIRQKQQKEEQIRNYNDFFYETPQYLRTSTAQLGTNQRNVLNELEPNQNRASTPSATSSNRASIPMDPNEIQRQKVIQQNNQRKAELQQFITDKLEREKQQKEQAHQIKMQERKRFQDLEDEDYSYKIKRMEQVQKVQQQVTDDWYRQAKLKEAAKQNLIISSSSNPFSVSPSKSKGNLTPKSKQSLKK